MMKRKKEKNTSFRPWQAAEKSSLPIFPTALSLDTSLTRIEFQYHFFSSGVVLLDGLHKLWNYEYYGQRHDDERGLQKYRRDLDLHPPCRCAKSPATSYSAPNPHTTAEHTRADGNTQYATRICTPFRIHKSSQHSLNFNITFFRWGRYDASLA